ncbi:MAG: alpha-amylase/4-alpha-glucanotransferase domain-containing protein [Gemmatimonadota bacterium]
MTEQKAPPLTFAFGLHAHQPEGNFDHVFEEHLRDVYQPFLDHAVAGGLLPLTLHLSGPLLGWMEKHHPAYLDRIGRMVADGQLEMLLSGYYEPILPSLTREDRIQQVLWMKDALKSRFGADATGLWLTERVWEPDLPADLVEAGVEYVLVDDRHFVASGFQRDELHAPFRTEAHGKSLGVFPIDERLRYFIPFQPPETTADYLKGLRRNGHHLAVFTDDIEKFGGWPGTREWVYEKGWLHRFTETLTHLREAGEIRFATFSRALEEVPSGGLAYLPSASYREMEEWSLPAPAFRRLAELKEILGEERFERGESPLVRGSHWRNFLVKYPEANRMHKKMVALSSLCRDRGDPEEARRALGRAQCNDAYWHGVFGGLYLRHLRDRVWENLAEAEGRLREGESLAWEEVDLDLDGHQELWVHSDRFSALVSPHRGGGVEELTLFHDRLNLANTLTRRREAYHTVNGSGDGGDEQHRNHEDEHGHGHHHGQGHHHGHGEGNPGEGHGGSEGTPSIHDMENSLRFSELPPVDPEDRRIFLERVLDGGVRERAYRTGNYPVLKSWGRDPMELLAPEASREPASGKDALAVRLRVGESQGQASLMKTLHFLEDGTLEAHFRWDAEAFPPGSLFTTELSLETEVVIRATPEGEIWRFPVATFSKSERGFDETVQGESVLVRWPVSAGAGSVRITRA